MREYVVNDGNIVSSNGKNITYSYSLDNVHACVITDIRGNIIDMYCTKSNMDNGKEYSIIRYKSDIATLILANNEQVIDITYNIVMNSGYVHYSRCGYNIYASLGTSSSKPHISELRTKELVRNVGKIIDMISGNKDSIFDINTIDVVSIPMIKHIYDSNMDPLYEYVMKGTDTMDIEQEPYYPYEIISARMEHVNGSTVLIDGNNVDAHIMGKIEYVTPHIHWNIFLSKINGTITMVVSGNSGLNNDDRFYKKLITLLDNKYVHNVGYIETVNQAAIDSIYDRN